MSTSETSSSSRKTAKAAPADDTDAASILGADHAHVQALEAGYYGDVEDDDDLTLAGVTKGS